MTSSGTCHQCGKIAHSYHYRTPRKDAFSPHDGFWHCSEHGPKSEVVQEQVKEHKAKDPTYGMNRAQRRAFKRTGREPA